MYIKQIELENFRIYHGSNKLDFNVGTDRNVFIISGNNGYGKTTLLTSLVWCLYGKLMIDVDDKFRKEIYDSGGYKKYATNNLNRLAKTSSCTSYKVSITLEDLYIPALPCKQICISRSFDIVKSEDSISIKIDGVENELTREVGHDIFINDFVLPKEVAKFFFFDAEKIVSLAEIKTIEEKKALSKAYSEILGIKKYEDLKYNLDELRLRFRKNSATEKDKQKLEELQKDVRQYKSLVKEYQVQMTTLNDEKLSQKKNSEKYQEKLIREGNALSLEELSDFKRIQKKLTEEAEAIKGKLKELMELAPFAMAGNRLAEVKEQLLGEADYSQKTLDSETIKKKTKNIIGDILEVEKKLKLKDDISEKLNELIKSSILKHFTTAPKSKDFKILIDLSDAENNEFNAIYGNLKNSFSIAFRQLVSDYKNNKIAFGKIVRKISEAESKENDLLIKEIRTRKISIDNRISEIDERLLQLSQEIGSIEREIANKSKVISELAKKIDVEKTDKVKDETAKRLSEELTEFITKLKSEKKQVLEKKLKKELNLLMHKSSFVNKVEVEIGQDIIDIHLYDKRGDLIIKETLSKGEQQLYATALLKALVDESNVDFPVFIDSPLQKFDKNHSKNIICEFYPKVAKQVILFPLLEKELTEVEYNLLLPKIGKTFLISNINSDCSRFEQIESSKLYTKYKELNEYVYQH